MGAAAEAAEAVAAGASDAFGQVAATTRHIDPPYRPALSNSCDERTGSPPGRPPATERQGSRSGTQHPYPIRLRCRAGTTRGAGEKPRDATPGVMLRPAIQPSAYQVPRPAPWRTMQPVLASRLK